MFGNPEPEPAASRLGDHDETQRVGEIDDRLRERVVAGRRADPVHERLVHLEDVDREAAQIAQRRVAGAEVVDGQPHTEIAQLAEPANGPVALHQHRLGWLR